MPLFQVNSDSTQLAEKRPVAFANELWHERRDLQPLLRENPTAIDPDLKIISEEFGDWVESTRRIDLLGLDRLGNLVVIELKRGDEGGHMELQALRYAAMVSAMDFEGVVHTYEAYLSRRSMVSTGVRDELIRFLGTPNPVITTTPRLVLVAPSFSREITTTVLWLNNQGLNIRCVAANLYKLHDLQYLNIEQVIPLPSASDYIVQLQAKQKSEQQVVQRQRGAQATVEDICKLSDEKGIGEPFRELLEATERFGLYAHPYRGQVISFKRRMNDQHSFLDASPSPRVPGKVHLWVNCERFAELYPLLTVDQAAAELGHQRERNVSPDEMRQFIAGLDRLVEKMSTLEVGSAEDLVKSKNGVAPAGNGTLEAESHLSPYDLSEKT